jgi:hypothetical protein
MPLSELMRAMGMDLVLSTQPPEWIAADADRLWPFMQE